MKIKNLFKDFINSFKPKITWLYIILFDLLFFGISVLLIKGMGSYLSKKTSVINLPTGDVLSMPPEQLGLISTQLQNLFISIVVLVVLIFIILIAVWCLTRGSIYSLLLKKKFTKKSFKKFILLNLFLFVVIFILLTFFLAVGTVLKNIVSYKYVFYAVFLAIAYYLSLNYIFFTKKNEVFNSIGKALTFGTKNIPKLFIPCLLILIVSALLTTLQSSINIPAQTLPFISLIIFIIFMAWARNYFVQEVNKIKE